MAKSLTYIDQRVMMQMCLMRTKLREKLIGGDIVLMTTNDAAVATMHRTTIKQNRWLWRQWTGSCTRNCRV